MTPPINPESGKREGLDMAVKVPKLMAVPVGRNVLRKKRQPPPPKLT